MSRTAADLVGSAEEFLAVHWNRVPRVQKAPARDWVRELLRVEDLDAILADRSLREPYVRVSMNGAPVHEKRYMREHAVNGTPVRGVLDVDKLAMEFASNASILL